MTRDGRAFDLTGNVHASSLPVAYGRAGRAITRAVRQEAKHRNSPNAAITWCRLVVAGKGEPHASIERSRVVAEREHADGR